jgi:hypothetical protein
MGKIERSVVFKQALACGLALTMVAPAVPASVAFADQSSAAQPTAAATATSIVDSGTGSAGMDDFYWTLDSNGTLDISGSGMIDYLVSDVPDVSRVKHIKVEQGVTTIGGETVTKEFTQLESVELSTSVTSINNYAFTSCPSLKSISIPESVTSIGQGAFSGCSGLKSISIPASVKSIDGAFSGCSGLESVQLPQNLTSIGAGAFSDCSSLRSLKLPSNLKSIGYYAFFGCSNLSSVDIPSGVTRIDVGSFRNCSALASVSIPLSVTNIDAGAFWGCEHLSDVNFSGSVRQWANVDIANGNDSLVYAPIHFAAAPSSFAEIMSDLSVTTPHARDIVWLADNGISTGYKNSDGTASFQGMTPVYRQDMAAFLRREAKLLGISDAATWTPSADDWNAFTDVNKDTPHAEDILWLHHAGIAQGYENSDGTYRFEGMTLIYRQDMAAFLHRLATLGNLGLEYDPNEDYDYGDGGSPFTETVYSDVNESTPHRDDIIWLTGNNISTGYDNGDGTYTYGGMTPTYRQDMAAFLHRFYGLKE